LSLISKQSWDLQTDSLYKGSNRKEKQSNKTKTEINDDEMTQGWYDRRGRRVGQVEDERGEKKKKD